MIEYDEGQYWVKRSRDAAPELARHGERLWYLASHPYGIETDELYEIGPRAEDQGIPAPAEGRRA